jgi:long-chain acyl-CoA synthetase
MSPISPIGPIPTLSPPPALSSQPTATPTLLTAWQSLVATAPDARALIEAATGETHTRASLQHRATTLASALHPSLVTLHSSPRPRGVAFSRLNGPDWLAAFLALLQLGGIPIPLDPSESPESQYTLAENARAAFLLTPDNQLQPVASAASSSAISRRLRPVGAGDQPEPHLQVSAVGRNPLVVTHSESSEPSRYSLLPAPPRPGATTALIKLTSGSTGTPRALAFTHAQMLADGRNVCASMDIRPDDLNLGLIPFGHSYGLGNLVIPLLAQGTAILCVSAPLHHAIAADCVRWQPTVFPAVPAILRILALTDVPAEALRSLRVIISAGSALPPETARAFSEKFGKRIHGFYGSSETGGITYDRSGDATLTGRSVGTPLDGVTLRFTRTKRFTVSSAAVFTKNNRRRSPDGHGAHMPADLAELNAHGELILLGRAGRMVKIASRRLDLTALEQEIKKLPGLRDAYTAPHPDRPDELAAVLATDLSPADARALLHRSLAAWKIPKRLIVLKEFPLTPRGKPDTKSLRAQLRS